MSIIEAHNIIHDYGKNRVLNDISLEVEKGDFVSILGESGSGKTTLISILGGIEKPTSGTVLIDGKEITAMRERELAILRRTKISYVFQFFNLAPYLTVEENILVPVLLNGKSKASVDDRLKDLLHFMGMTDKRDMLPGKLSGGEQQRVAIARGMIFNPDIIFLDEPTGNLDRRNSNDVMKLLFNVNRQYGTTIVQVTHSGLNAGYGNKLITISDGKIVSTTVLPGQLPVTEDEE